jgi:hypothetical protein
VEITVAPYFFFEERRKAMSVGTAPTAPGVAPAVVLDAVPHLDPNHDADAFFADEGSPASDDPGVAMVGKGSYVETPSSQTPVDNDDPLDVPAPVGNRDSNGRFAPKPKAQPAAPAKGNAPAPAATKTPAVLATPAAPADPLADWDANLLAEADSRGLTKEDAAAFGEPELLRRALIAMDRRDLARIKAGQADTTIATGEAAVQSASSATTTPPVATSTPAAPVAAATPAPSAAAKAVLDKLAINLNPDEYDPEVIGQFNAIGEYVTQQSQQITQLNGMVEQLMNAHRSQIEQQIEAEAERFFASLPDEYADEIGKGLTQDLSAPNQVQVRRELFSDALHLQQIARNSGRTPKSLTELLQRSTDVRFVDKQKQIARREIAKQVADRRTQQVARPTHSRAPNGSPEEQAASFARTFFAERGVQTTEDELSVLE